MPPLIKKAFSPQFFYQLTAECRELDFQFIQDLGFRICLEASLGSGILCRRFGRLAGNRPEMEAIDSESNGHRERAGTLQ